MKMKFRGVSLAAALLSARMIFAPGAAIGDEGNGSVGDLPGYRHLPATFVGDDEADWEGEEAESMSDDSPISYSDLHPSTTEHVVSGSPSRSVSRRGQRRGGLMNRAEDAWLSAELLLWFPQQRRTPPLVAVGPAGVDPVLGEAGVETAFGGDVGGGLTPGFRIDAGRYLTKNFGIGGRFWFLGEDSEGFAASGDGTGASIGRPFYDVDVPGNRSIRVNLANDVFFGDVSIESELDLIAAEAYGRLNFDRGSNYTVDLLGGYTFFGIDDRLSAQSTTVSGANAGSVGGTPGQVRTFQDEFDAENRFHGGQLGMEMSLTKGCWMLTSLTKVHLGNMNQSIGIRGTGTDDPDGVSGATTYQVGALALDTQGEFERDRFAFAPEVNLKLAYRFRPNVLLSVGYSFLYFDNVLLAGEHVDPLFDTAGGAPPSGGPFNQRPFEFRDSSLWVQGIDLGFVLDF